MKVTTALSPTAQFALPTLIAKLAVSVQLATAPAGIGAGPASALLHPPVITLALASMRVPPRHASVIAVSRLIAPFALLTLLARPHTPPTSETAPAAGAQLETPLPLLA